MRLFLALIATKLSRVLLRLTGRGGTALPGKIGLRLCPDLIARLSERLNIVAVTGTNGKTTTSRMIEQILLDAQLPVMANRSGSNLEQGIAAELAANASLLGRPKRDCAVIECDEAAFRSVAGAMQPKVIVVTNLFRDQLDRYGEVTHTLELIREGVRKCPSALLCLNADCSLTASLAVGAENPVRLFGMDKTEGAAGAVSDAPRCIYCGAEYEYEYHSFAHLGGFRCPGCGYKRSEPAVSVAHIRSLGAESSEAELRIDGAYYPATVALPAAYNLYNAAAAVAAATAVGVSAERAIVSLGAVKSGFGRMESFELGGKSVMLILIKNPAGCDRALDYLAALPGEHLDVFCLNDNFADGTDISWIWDSAFERLFEGGAQRRLIVSGTRAEDMRLRLKYAGADENLIRLERGDEALLRAVSESSLPVYILPTYTAMLPLREQLGKLCGKKEFWE